MTKRTAKPTIRPADLKRVDEQMSNWTSFLSEATELKGAKADLARAADIHHVFTSRLASGVQEPSLRTALAIANAFGRPIQKML